MASPSPLITVVIPSYNSEATIAAAIDSVLAQTYTALDIVVVDDGSTDSTREIVARYPPPVRLLTQSNVGPSIARNRGAASSTAPFLAFLDSDDEWHPLKLERQLRLLQSNPEAVLCYTALLMRKLDGTTSPAPLADPSTIAETLRLCNPSIPPSCVLVRSSAFQIAEGFHQTQKGCEDWDLWFRLCKVGSFCALNDPLTVYQMSVTGLSANADSMYRDFENLLQNQLLRDLKGLKKIIWDRKIRSFQCYKAALTARGASQSDREFSYALRSLLTWPSPLWHPQRFKACAVTMRNYLQRRLHSTS